MRLLHCYVENFGKLRKFSYTFSDTLSVIKGENGWGKSTLAVFIKAMLYGLPASRSTDLLENERKRYAPWNGELFGGSLSILVGDRRYRIERVFGRRESDDVFKLFSIDTGLPSDDYTARIGEEIFGIDEEGYERSTYFSQRPLAERSGYGSIQSRLSEQEDLTLSERAFRLLDKRRKYYQMTGNRGKIAELDLAISEQTRLLEEAEGEKQRLAEAKEKRKRYAEMIEETEAKRKQVADEADRALAAKSRRLLSETAERLTSSRDRALEKQSTLAAEIGESIPSEEQIAEVLADTPEIERLLVEEAKTADRRMRRRRLVRRAQAYALSLASIASVILLLVPIYLLAALALTATALLAFSLVSSLVKTRRESVEPLHGKRLIELLERRRALLEPLTPIVSDASLTDDPARLSVLREKRIALSAAEAELSRANAELSAFLSEHPTASEPIAEEPIESGDPAALRVEADRLYLEIDRMRTELPSLEHAERMIADTVERIPAHIAMLDRLRDERAIAAKHLAAILRTAELLESARASLITRYRDIVETSFIGYVGELSSSVGRSFADDARSFTVSGEFDVAIAEGGVTRSPILYSTGYRDLFALCLRFALTDALFPEEKAPMILDDPFVNLDDERLGAAIKLLKRLSGDRQILYFTCSSARTPDFSAEKSV